MDEKTKTHTEDTYVKYTVTENGSFKVYDFTSPGQKHDTVITTCEGDRFLVMKSMLNASDLFQRMTLDDTEVNLVPLLDLTTKQMIMVMTYLIDHLEGDYAVIKKPIDTNNMHELVPKKDADLMDVDVLSACELANAANYLDIEPLVSLACCKIATFTFGQTPEKLNELLGVSEPFTAIEEEMVRTAHPWIIPKPEKL